MRHWKPVITIVFLGSLLVTPLGTRNTSASVDEPTAEDVASAIAFRTSAGFMSDPDQVKESFFDATGYPDREWGLPLSESESQDILNRLRLRYGVRDAVSYATQQADLGGIWFDQQHDGLAHFQFTSDIAAHQASLASLITNGAAYVVDQVDRTLTELNRAIDLITHDSAIGEAGRDWTFVGINPRSNGVVIETNADASVASYLHERYGVPVETEPTATAQLDACVDRTDCAGPLKGGLFISEIPSPHNECTSSFFAKKDTGTLVFVTAGHCFSENHAGNGIGNDWQHVVSSPPDPVGTSLNETWDTLTNGVADLDVGWMSVDSTYHVGPYYEVYGNGATDIKTITYVAGNSDLQIGDYVCSSKYQVVHWHCGYIDGWGTFGVDGHMVTHEREVPWDSHPGDSGAPYLIVAVSPYGTFWGDAGVHNDSSTDPCTSGCHSWFTTTQSIADYTVLSPCTLYTC